MLFRAPHLALICIAAAAPHPASAQPAITSGRIGLGTIDVTKPNPSPTLILNITGTASSIIVQYQSPSGLQNASETFFSQQTNTYEQGPGFTGKVVLQGYVSKFTGAGSVLSAYAEPGKWSLTNLAVCSPNNPCTAYNGASLTALFPKLTFNVVNPGTPDTTPPTATSGTILTPAVSIANGPQPAIEIHATDDLSGVNTIVAYAYTSGDAASLSLSNTFPTRPNPTEPLRLTTTLQPGTATGTYTINSVLLQDNVGNVSYLNDPAAIAKLFDNKITITVTN